VRKFTLVDQLLQLRIETDDSSSCGPNPRIPMHAHWHDAGTVLVKEQRLGWQSCREPSPWRYGAGAFDGGTTVIPPQAARVASREQSA
jgi:hypothetical protein